MEEHETFEEFYAKLMDIVNSSFNLGEPIPNSKVINRKNSQISSEEIYSKIHNH